MRGAFTKKKAEARNQSKFETYKTFKNVDWREIDEERKIERGRTRESEQEREKELQIQELNCFIQNKKSINVYQNFSSQKSTRS